MSTVISPLDGFQIMAKLPSEAKAGQMRLVLLPRLVVTSEVSVLGSSKCQS